MEDHRAVGDRDARRRPVRSSWATMDGKPPISSSVELSPQGDRCIRMNRSDVRHSCVRIPLRRDRCRLQASGRKATQAWNVAHGYAHVDSVRQARWSIAAAGPSTRRRHYGREAAREGHRSRDYELGSQSPLNSGDGFPLTHVRTSPSASSLALLRNVYSHLFIGIYINENITSPSRLGSDARHTSTADDE